MGKLTFTPKLWNGISFLQSALSQFSLIDRVRKGRKKSEEKKTFTIKLTQKDQERYLHSFLKKRILITWQEQRSQVHFYSLVSPPTSKKTYQDTYKRLRPLLIAAYTEDFKIPFTDFTLKSWIQYVQLLAQITGKYRDAKHWEELGIFLCSCTNEDV